ncbi:MAG: DNA repair protein RadC, partial [candidate division KSB1 bacterium]|nr:DNA repair protein RadC [candidate division KSB1 bacterium]
MQKYPLRLAEWPENERPRERLLKHGAESLSDAELLAIILRTGNHGQSVMDLARKLLVEARGFHGLDAKAAEELCQIHGMGAAKTAQLKAALEIGKRLSRAQHEEQPYIRTSRDVFDYLHLRLCNQPREQFFILLLNARNRLLRERKVFEGSLQESMVNAREVVKLAINEQAAGIIFVHNHPSGEPEPSEDDLEITERLVAAARLVGIRVLDHVIIGRNGYFSFADH